MAAPGNDQPEARTEALEGDGREATEAPAKLLGARAPTKPVHTCQSLRNPAEEMQKDLKLAEILGKHLLQQNPSMTKFLKARHFLEPVIWGSFPGDVRRANRMWIMLLHTKICFSSNVPPINETPDTPTMQFLDDLVQKSYSTEEEKTCLKDSLKKLKLTTLNHDALETFLTEFEALSRALEEIDTFSVNRKDYLLNAVPAHVAAKIRENLNADTFETAKTLLFRIVTHEVLNPQKKTLNNAQFGRRRRHRVNGRDRTPGMHERGHLLQLQAGLPPHCRVPHLPHEQSSSRSQGLRKRVNVRVQLMAAGTTNVKQGENVPTCSARDSHKPPCSAHMPDDAVIPPIILVDTPALPPHDDTDTYIHTHTMPDQPFRPSQEDCLVLRKSSDMSKHLIKQWNALSDDDPHDLYRGSPHLRPNNTSAHESLDDTNASCPNSRLHTYAPQELHFTAPNDNLLLAHTRLANCYSKRYIETLDYTVRPRFFQRNHDERTHGVQVTPAH
jgi:hypothetical protein